jgi:hypothetical protein
LPTVAEIITFAKRKTKESGSETDANLIIDLDGIQDEIYLELNKYRLAFSYFDIYSTLSVAGTLNYTLPVDCKVENIQSIQMSQNTSIDDDTEWDTFEYAGIDDDITTGYIWGKGSESGKIALSVDGGTIQTDGLTIRIFYLPTPTQITATTQTPDLDKMYHNLYKYALVQDLASQGDNPDTAIADYYQRKYDDLMQKVKDDLADKYFACPDRVHQADEIW